jgi:hypothetical protein
VWIEKSEVRTSLTLDWSLSLVVFVKTKLTTWGVPQRVPRFLNGGQRTALDHHHTHALPPSRHGLGPDLGQIGQTRANLIHLLTRTSSSTFQHTILVRYELNFYQLSCKIVLGLIHFLTFTSILKNRLITNKYLIFHFIKYFFSKINVKSLNRDILTTKF